MLVTAPLSATTAPARARSNQAATAAWFRVHLVQSGESAAASDPKDSPRALFGLRQADPVEAAITKGTLPSPRERLRADGASGKEGAIVELLHVLLEMRGP